MKKPSIEIGKLPRCERFVPQGNEKCSIVTLLHSIDESLRSIDERLRWANERAVADVGMGTRSRRGQD